VLKHLLWFYHCNLVNYHRWQYMLGESNPKFGGIVALSASMLLNILTLTSILSRAEVTFVSTHLTSFWATLIALVVLAVNYIYAKVSGGIERLKENWEAQPELVIKRGRFVSIAYFYGTIAAFFLTL